MAHLSNVCNVDCNLRALLLDGTDEPVHRVHDAMVIIPAGRGVYVAPAFIVPEKDAVGDSWPTPTLWGALADAAAMQITCATGGKTLR